MASNYNNALRLEMIGTGEQAGVWGETTNNNLGTLLVDAVAGYTSVSVTSTSQALTAVDGLEDQSRNAMIALSPSGAVTTTYNVYIPRSSKSYVFYNTSGSYSAVIYNSTVTGDTTAAGTGVTIPAGKTMTVWSDGTNVAQQITHLDTPTIASPTIASPTVANGTFTSPTLVTPALGTPASGVLTNATGLPLTTGVTGTLPVANGGTGVTTSTGSGSVVLSNSPTLVTPALGTPASGTLTNATGLPIVAGTTGTLSVARGGTGVTSSTGSGNVVLSTSPTLVTPALGTPSSGTLTNCTFPTLNQNTTGTAAYATYPSGGGTFVTSSNIGSQSVNYANYSGYTTGNAATATSPASGGSFITSSNIGSQSVNYSSSTGSVAYSNVSGRPSVGYRQVYSGTLTYGVVSSKNFQFTIYYSGSPGREAVSPESFVITTALNDYYTTSGSGYNTITTTKQVYLSQNTINSRFGFTIAMNSYPYPNQINVVIYVLDSTAVTELIAI